MDNFREWLSDNLRYILLGLAIVLVAVIAVFAVKLVSGLGSPKKSGESESKNVVVETDTSSETDTQTQTEENQEPLTEDDPALLEAVQKYYTAMGNKDMAVLESMVESLSDSDRQKVESSIIESYNNIKVYSKKGLAEGSYVIYAYYEAKVADIEELVPSLTCLYMRTKEDGSLYVADQEADEETKAYIAARKEDADVQALIVRVDEAYREIVENNEQLRKIINELDEPETEIAIPDAGDVDVQADQAVMTTDALNVRADSREDADLIATLDAGTQVTRTRVLDNGWAEIKYGDGVGYVLNEYLTDVSQ